MNCLIETLSLMRKLPEKPWLYRTAEMGMLPEGQRERRFSGKQTNEAPTKYFLWSLAARGELFDRILLIVSRECMQLRSEALSGRSTFEFFRDAMTAYMEELATEWPKLRRALDEGWGGSARAYLDAVLTPVSVPERMDPAEWQDIVNALFTVGGDAIELYVDFTGGSRVASLISLLLLRILKSENAQVRQVIYADIQDAQDPKLVDCTKSYGILTAIEEIAGAGASGENRNAKINEVFAQYGLTDQSAVERSKKTDAELRRAEDDLRVKRPPLQEPKTEDSEIVGGPAASALQRRVEQREKETLQNEKAKSPFRKLIENKRRPEDLITGFYEAIYLVFYDYHVFVSTIREKDAPKQIPNLLKSHDEYYSYQRNYGWTVYEYGVIPQTKRWLKKLLEMPQYRPLKTFDRGLRIDLREYSKWFEKERYVNGVSAAYTTVFERFLQENGIEISDYSFRTLSDWERVYFNYKFPFMCVNVKSAQCCPEITDYYLTCVRSLMERLEALYDSDRQEYQHELKRLIDLDSALESEIPYMMEFKTLWLNREGFTSGEAADTFIRTLCKRLELVRPYRNAIAHRLTNSNSDPAAQKKMAEEIRAWLREYEADFPAPWKL